MSKRMSKRDLNRFIIKHDNYVYNRSSSNKPLNVAFDRRKFDKWKLSQYDRSESTNIDGSGVFGVIFIILCLFAFSSVLMGRDSSLSFTGLLNSISSMPTIDMSRVFNFVDDFNITSDWTVFNWFRDFLNNFFLPLFGVAIYFCTAIAQLIVFLVWVFKFIFTGVY